MKRSELKKQIEEAIVELLGEAGLYTLKDPKKSILGLSQTIDPDDNTENSPQFRTLYKKVAESEDDDSTEEKEPTKAELKKNAGVAKIKDELAKVTKEMKDLAKEYTKAEGDKKDKIKNQLKDLTAKKKDLEKRLDKSL